MAELLPWELTYATPTPTPTPDQMPPWERDYSTPTPTPSPEGGFQFLPRSGAQMDVAEGRQAVQPAVETLGEMPYVRGVVGELMQQVPTSFGEAGRIIGGAVGPEVGGIEDIVHTGGQLADLIRGKSLDEVSPPGKPYDEYTAEDWGRLTGQIGVQGLQALPLVGEGLKLPLRAPEPLAVPRVPPDLPPTPSMGPGTIAGDVSNALQWSPESPPITPLEQTVANVQPPGPYVSPETGFTHYPGLEGGQPVPSETARFTPPPPPIGTPLNPVPLLGPQGTTAADVAAAQPPVAPAAAPEVPLPYTPEAAAARAAQPQPAMPASEPVGGNVAGFEKVYGPGEVPAGGTITPEDAWDAAHERAATGKSQPYGFVDRAKTGAITPEEMGDLIYEHHRLVERAAQVEGKPEYGAAYQAAHDFANNVLKPAENAWHQKGMQMQIARPVNFETQTGMNLAAERMKVEIKANEVAEAKRHVRENAKAANDVQASEGKLMNAMDKEYSRGAKRPPKTAEQLRAQLAETEPCAL